jgi:nitrogen fixation protein FixH
MPNGNSATPQRPLRGRTVLAALLGFFGVVVGVNMIMMTLAIRTLPGTEVDSAYRASLRFNGEIEAAREQDARGWRIVAQVDRAADGHAAIRVEARDAQAAPLAGFDMTAQLQRPANKRGDRTAALVEREIGIYRGAAVDVAAGQWDLVIEAGRAGKRLFLSRNRLILD